MSRYDEAGSSNSGNGSGFRNSVNGSLNRNSLSVNRATDSTRGTTPAIGNFHIIHPYFRIPAFNFYSVFFTDDDWKKKMLESMSLTNSILRALVPSSVFVGNNLTKNIGCFRNTVEKNLDLPLKEAENVSALNTALIDIDLSVSLVSQNILFFHWQSHFSFFF